MGGDTGRRRGGTMGGVARGCEALVRLAGRLCSWLLVALAVVIVAQVVLRYAFGRPLNVLGELQWHLYALIGIAGLSYTMAEHGHVRVDLFYSKYPRGLSRWVDAFGLVFFVIPLGCFLLIKGIDFVIPAFSVGEASPEPDGLPFRWLIKAAIPAGALLLIVEAAARLVLTFVEEEPVVGEGRPES